MTTRQRDVILGLIGLHPGVTGYELRAIIERSTGYFFSASLSQIYPVLKGLLEEGLVTVEDNSGDGGRWRKQYTVTEAGEQAHREWLASPITYESSLSDFRTFLLRYTFLVAAEPAVIRTFLMDGLAHFRAERERIEADSLATEQDYVGGLESAPIYVAGWRHEIAFLLEDVDRKIDWIIEALRLLEAGRIGAPQSSAAEG